MFETYVKQKIADLDIEYENDKKTWEYTIYLEVVTQS